MIGGSLAAAGVVWGLLTWWVFRSFANRAGLRTVRRHLYAHLLEIRLYSEEPGLVWRAQKALLAENVRLFRLLAPPMLIMAVPVAFLYPLLDSAYGWRPIAVGSSAVVTAQLARELTAEDAGDRLLVPPGVVTVTLT